MQVLYDLHEGQDVFRIDYPSYRQYSKREDRSCDKEACLEAQIQMVRQTQRGNHAKDGTDLLSL